MYSFVFALGTAYFVPITVVTAEYFEGELAYYGYPIVFIGQEIPENTENTEIGRASCRERV